MTDDDPGLINIRAVPLDFCQFTAVPERGIAIDARNGTLSAQ